MLLLVDRWSIRSQSNISLHGNSGEIPKRQVPKQVWMRWISCQDNFTCTDVTASKGSQRPPFIDTPLTRSPLKGQGQTPVIQGKLLWEEIQTRDPYSIGSWEGKIMLVIRLHWIIDESCVCSMLRWGDAMWREVIAHGSVGPGEHVASDQEPCPHYDNAPTQTWGSIDLWTLAGPIIHSKATFT